MEHILEEVMKMEQKTELTERKTLLVVDDDPTVLEFLTDVFKGDFELMIAPRRGGGHSIIERA